MNTHTSSALLANEAQKLREALEKFKGGDAVFSAAGHVVFEETEDWPRIDLNCGLAVNKLVRNPLARYIAAACNAAPALLREIERLRAENERERASRQQAQRELEQAQEDRNRARMRGEVDARRTLQPIIDRAVATEREACALVCESHMDKAEQDKADQRARDAEARGDMEDQLARLQHWSVVSTFNAGLRNAAKDIRARGADQQPAAEASHA